MEPDKPDSSELEDVPVSFSSAQSFEKAVFAYYGPRCVNCGTSDQIAMILIVPEEAGGHRKLSNATVLCRLCDLMRETKKSSNGEGTFVVSLNITEDFRLKMENLLKSNSSVRSWSALARLLMSKWVNSDSDYSSLAMYQEPEDKVVSKITIRVDRDVYALFSEEARATGLLISDAIKALYMMYMMGFESKNGGNQ